MFIRKKTSQHRRDFQAIYECEHCGETEAGYGYDDLYFHNEVIPNKECKKCEKTSLGVVTSSPKYPPWLEL